MGWLVGDEMCEECCGMSAVRWVVVWWVLWEKWYEMNGLRWAWWGMTGERWVVWDEWYGMIWDDWGMTEGCAVWDDWLRDEGCVRSGVRWMVWGEWCGMSCVMWDEWCEMSGVWWVASDECCGMSGCAMGAVWRVVCDEWYEMTGERWLVGDDWLHLPHSSSFRRLCVLHLPQHSQPRPWRRPSAQQVVPEPLCTAPATPQPLRRQSRSSSFRSLYVLRLSAAAAQQVGAATAATIRHGSPSGTSVYRACHATGSRANPRRSCVRKLCVLRLPSNTSVRWVVWDELCVRWRRWVADEMSDVRWVVVWDELGMRWVVWDELFVCEMSCVGDAMCEMSGVRCVVVRWGERGAAAWCDVWSEK